MKTEQTFSNALCMRTLKAPAEFCSGGIRGSSQVEMLVGHLKHNICGNLSTWRRWRHMTWATCRLKYAIQHGFCSGQRASVKQPGIKGLTIPWRLSPATCDCKPMFAVWIRNMFSLQLLITLYVVIVFVSTIRGSQHAYYLFIREFDSILKSDSQSVVVLR